MHLRLASAKKFSVAREYSLVVVGFTTPLGQLSLLFIVDLDVGRRVMFNVFYQMSAFSDRLDFSAFVELMFNFQGSAQHRVN